MIYDEFNKFCDSLTATSYVMQWGGSHVWKVGGKVFAIGGWGEGDKPAYTFKVSPEDFHFLDEKPGYRPAPYMASRGMTWIQHYDVAKKTKKGTEISHPRIASDCVDWVEQEETKRVGFESIRN